MPKHKVTMTLPPRQIRRADASFAVERDGKKYGTLEISNGSIVWFPPYTKYGLKMGWEKFHQLMDEHATRVESR
ncbi:MAG: hypothetical protein AAGF97_06420 [Planctomycetota bacterium]